MKLLTGLFRKARKRTQTTDNDMGMFREKLTELVEKKAELPDEEVAKRVDELKEMTVDLPESDEKSELDLYLEDMKSVKEQDDATAKEAVSMVADLFEKLDTEAMKNAPDVDGEKPAETEAEEVVEETKAEDETSDAEGTVGEYVKENVEEDVDNITQTKEPLTDDNPNAEYSLEEIYQFCKKRREEDEAAAADAACAEDSAEEVEEEKEEEDEEEEVVTDHAPRIPVTMNGTTAAKGSLADMFDKIKEGGR